MAHEIAELAEGVHAAAFARHAAWHRLGTTVESTMTGQQALEAAHLAGWNVRKVAMQVPELAQLSDEGVTPFTVPDRFSVIFTNPITGQNQYLPGGVVGSNFEPIQNEANIDLLDAIVDESGAHFETLGALNGGARTFVSMKVPTTMQIGGVDPMDLYLVGINNHVGSGAFKFVITPVRVVCSNTVAAALRNAKSTFSIRHTSGATDRVYTEAREALGLTFKYTGEFEEAAERLIQESMTNRQFDAWAAKLLKADADSTRAKNKQAASLDAMKTLWRESDTLSGIKNTRWAAYNVFTEFTDHFAPVKLTAGKADLDVARASRAVTLQTTIADKERAFASLLPA